MLSLDHSAQPHRRIAGAVALGTLSLHAAAWLAFFPTHLQFAKYPQAARALVDGTFDPQRIADLSPLYLGVHVVATLAAIPAPVIVTLQLLALAGASALLYDLTRRLVPGRYAVIGAAAFAASASAVIYAPIFEPEALLIFALVALAWALSTRWLRPGGAWLCGGILGACLLLRPTMLPVAAAVPVLVRFAHSAWPTIRQTLAFAAGPSLALAAMTMLGAHVQGRATALVMNPGYVVYEGNNPLSRTGAAYTPLVAQMKTEGAAVFDNPHTSDRTLAGVEQGAPLSARAVNAQWLARARDFVVDEPAHFLKAQGFKVFAVLHSYRRHDLVPAFSYDGRLPVPLVPFAAIAFAAVAGVALDRRRWRQWLIPAAIGANQVLVMLLVYVSDRQRLALLPFAACLAAIGVARLTALAPGRRMGAAAALLVLAAAFSIPTARMRDYTYLWRNAAIADAAWVEALVKRNAGDVDGARRASAVALAHAPWLPTFSRPAEIRAGGDSALARLALTVRSWGDSPSELFDQATLLRLARDHDAAARLQGVLAERGARLDRQYLQSSDPRYYLARHELRHGARDEARALLAQVLRDAPGDPFALALLAVLEPGATHEQTLVRYFGPADAHYLIGVAGLLASDPLHAAARFEALAPFIPDSRQRQLLLAAAYSRAGKAERSVRAFETAMIPGTEPVWFEDEVIAAYDTLLAQRPDDPRLTEGFLRALEAFGR